MVPTGVRACKVVLPITCRMHPQHATTTLWLEQLFFCFWCTEINHCSPENCEQGDGDNQYIL